MVKWIKALTLCLWLKATLGQKLEWASKLTFFLIFFWSIRLGFGHGKIRPRMKHCWLRHIVRVSGRAYAVLQPVQPIWWWQALTTFQEMFQLPKQKPTPMDGGLEQGPVGGGDTQHGGCPMRESSLKETLACLLHHVGCGGGMRTLR